MSITPLKPEVPLPSHPGDHRSQLCYYELARPFSIRTHVRRFECSFDDVQDSEPVPYEIFGPWAAEIGYSLFLLAEQLEYNWIDHVHNPEHAALAGNLHRYSGYWMFLQVRNGDDIEAIVALCDETWELMGQVGKLAPGFLWF